jgi:hypothetical protein
MSVIPNIVHVLKVETTSRGSERALLPGTEGAYKEAAPATIVPASAA